MLTDELTAVQSLAGSLHNIDQAACALETVVASAIIQVIGRNAHVSIILKANAMLKELK
jgi:hypothetical protein